MPTAPPLGLTVTLMVLEPSGRSRATSPPPIARDPLSAPDCQVTCAPGSVDCARKTAVLVPAGVQMSYVRSLDANPKTWFCPDVSTSRSDSLVSPVALSQSPVRSSAGQRTAANRLVE
jgi:hypothetical protein